ncbi:MAG TPA: hypothetical protein VHV55_15295 [Pirellulales bacterium]|jgi:hypothetical protein|nr:hypothetical protein [Pirellulales bacterium]
MSEKGNHSAVGGAWCENSRQAGQAGGEHRSVEIATGFHFTDAISDDTLKPVRTSGPIVSRRRGGLPSCRITAVAAVANAAASSRLMLPPCASAFAAVSWLDINRRMIERPAALL